MQNPPNILAERETLGRLKKQQCSEPRSFKTPSAAVGVSFVRLGRDEQHKENFRQWLLILKRYLEMERGRITKLAVHLGVNRQSCWRWFIQEHGRVPAWAAVTANVWLSTKLSPQLFNLLKRAVCPAGGRQARPGLKEEHLTLL